MALPRIISVGLKRLDSAATATLFPRPVRWLYSPNPQSQSTLRRFKWYRPRSGGLAVVDRHPQLAATDLVVAGWDLIYANDVIIHHFPSPRRDAPPRRRLLWRNALWFSWLRRPAASVLRDSFRALWQGAIDATLRPGFLDAVAGLPWALRHRRAVSPPVERLFRLLTAAEIAHTSVSPSPSMPPHLLP